MIMNRRSESPETTELELMRLLHGEMPAEQARLLRGRLEREPELAAAWARLERTWSGLELPPAAPAPPGFTRRVLARRPRNDHGLSWSAAPVWVRAAAAAALAIGLALGAGAGSRVGNVEPGVADSASTSIATVQSASDDAETSLAESYWDSLGESQ
jgi:anti-sigma factor RsiW